MVAGFLLGSRVSVTGGEKPAAYDVREGTEGRSEKEVVLLCNMIPTRQFHLPRQSPSAGSKRHSRMCPSCLGSWSSKRLLNTNGLGMFASAQQNGLGTKETAVCQ